MPVGAFTTLFLGLPMWAEGGDGLLLNHWSIFLRSLGLIATPTSFGLCSCVNVADCLERLRTKLDARGEVVDPDLRHRLIDQHSIDQDVDPDGPLTLTITIEPPANPSAQRQRINALRELARARWNAEVPEAFAEFHERVHRLSFDASSEQDELWSLGFETATIAEVLDACATRYRDQPIVPIIEDGRLDSNGLSCFPFATHVGRGRLHALQSSQNLVVSSPLVLCSRFDTRDWMRA